MFVQHAQTVPLLFTKLRNKLERNTFHANQNIKIHITKYFCFKPELSIFIYSYNKLRLPCASIKHCLVSVEVLLPVLQEEEKNSQ